MNRPSSTWIVIGIVALLLLAAGAGWALSRSVPDDDSPKLEVTYLAWSDLAEHDNSFSRGDRVTAVLEFTMVGGSGTAEICLVEVDDAGNEIPLTGTDPDTACETVSRAKGDHGSLQLTIETSQETARVFVRGAEDKALELARS